jgi:ABC-2 type transport system ATP-binding protein
VIELEHVTKRYRRRGVRSEALRDVSVRIPAGSVWAVVGPNGAGKSTLLALVLGFIRPTSGTVRVGGTAPGEYLRERGAAYLPERFSLPREWRAGDALRMFARLEGGTPDDALRVITELGLAPHVDKRAGELSRGLLQRLGLAQALLTRRELVVLDEPTEGLDPIWRMRLRDIVARLSASGCTVLIASHDLGEVERIAERALLLENGSVREVLDTRLPGEPTSYSIRLAAAFPRVADAFPDARMADDRTSFSVTVSGPVELSERVGALIGLGGVITAVEPERHDLEDRVRAALSEDA